MDPESFDPESFDPEAFAQESGLSPEQLQELMAQMAQMGGAQAAGAPPEQAAVRLPIVEVPADATTEVVMWVGEGESRTCIVGTPARCLTQLSLCWFDCFGWQL